MHNQYYIPVYKTETSVNIKNKEISDVLRKFSYNQSTAVDIIKHILKPGFIYIRYSGLSFLFLAFLLCILRNKKLILDIPTPPTILRFGTAKQKIISVLIIYLSKKAYKVITPVDCKRILKNKIIISNGTKFFHKNKTDRLPNLIWAGSEITNYTLSKLNFWWGLNYKYFPQSNLLIYGNANHINKKKYSNLIFMGEKTTNDLENIYNNNKIGLGTIPRHGQESLDFAAMKHRDILGAGMLLILFSGDSSIEKIFSNRIVKVNLDYELDEFKVNEIKNKYDINKRELETQQKNFLNFHARFLHEMKKIHD